MATSIVSPIRDYITSTLTQIREGIPFGAYIDDKISFELLTVSQIGKDGKIDVGVLNSGANASPQQTHKVTFSMRFRSKEELAKDAINAAVMAQTEQTKPPRDKIREKLNRTFGKAAETPLKKRVKQNK